MESAASALEAQLWGETVKGDDIMDAALKRANECSFCRTRAAADMRTFSRMFATVVERAISNVRDITLEKSQAITFFSGMVDAYIYPQVTVCTEIKHAPQGC